MMSPDEEARALEWRFDELKRTTGMSQAEFARTYKVPGGASMLNQHTKGHRPISLAAALAYAKGFQCELADISPRLAKTLQQAELLKKGSTQGDAVTAVSEADSPGDGYIQIRESQVRFAAGNGRSAHFDELQDSVPATYRQEWFSKEGINPANARRFKVDGDSMEPFLFHGDTVLVNLAETSIINGKVYALRYGEELRIKRVYRKLDGGLILHSDNPDYLPRDEEIPPAVVEEHIAIIGRVRDKSGTGGL